MQVSGGQEVVVCFLALAEMTGSFQQTAALDLSHLSRRCTWCQEACDHIDGRGLKGDGAARCGNDHDIEMGRCRLTILRERDYN